MSNSSEHTVPMCTDAAAVAGHQPPKAHVRTVDTAWFQLAPDRQMHVEIGSPAYQRLISDGHSPTKPPRKGAP